MDNNILNSFKLQDTLSDLIWLNHDSNDFSSIKLKPEIRTACLKIAKDFIDYFKIESIVIEDIYFVGSLTNYNWSNFSDIDIHVIVDKSKINADSDVVDELFDAKKTVYNEVHDIKIKGFDVELYAQDVNEDLESSKGLYSILYNKWLNTPVKNNFTLDKKSILKKVKEFNTRLAKLEKLPNTEDKVKQIDDFKDRIKKYRKSGLQKGGELSNENLIFKYLRRSGFMEKLIDLKTKTQDSILSLENVEFSQNK